MLSAVTILLALAGAVLLLPAAMLAAEAAASVLPARRRLPAAARSKPVAILVPAHDEASGIAETVAAIRADMSPGDRLLVVADNCSDDTAGLARAAGAEVIERQSLTARGKGYALTAGLIHLEATGPCATVVFLDADCRPAAGTIDALATACEATGLPAQGRYEMELPEAASMAARISAFAWRVKSEIRPRGCMRLGLPVQLMGTGMAMPREVAAGLDFATGHITEDLLLTVALARMGRSPEFCPAACVTSRFAPSEEGRSVQKERWMHGHLSVIAAEVPGLVREAIRQRDMRRLGIAADISIPPLALMVAAQLAFAILSSLWLTISGSGLVLSLAAVGLAASAFAVTLSWWRVGRDLVDPARLLMHLPAYIGAQLASGARFLSGRRSGWTRTERPS